MSELKFKENDLVEFRGGALHRVVSIIDPEKGIYEVSQEAKNLPAWARIYRRAHEDELRHGFFRTCECGVDFLGAGKHSHWCPAYRAGA